ncbi:MAG TPA: 2-dehydropantoate 2-reductase [Acetobacteraceae bacterium]|jgi:2-dehydropantoate 2-reductase|nr:2-dehydropantoate 2-reductase [Acetobacteraceae bacterium]
MRLLVVGAGATGGYFGGRLAQAGRDVTFLVRPGRAAQLRADGLRIVSPHGDAVIAPNIVLANEVRDPYEAVLLTVKAYALDAALEDFAPAVGPGTMIMPVLNGMRHVDVLAARFGKSAVIGGVCRVATTIDDDGRIVQLAPFQDLAYGEMDGAASERTAALDAFLQCGGFTARLSRAVVAEMWEKWTLLASMGAINCLMRGTVGEIVAAPGGADFVRAMIAEVVAVADAAGVRPRDAALANMNEMLTAQSSSLASSMYRDLQRGAPVEADHIVGDMLVRGREAGIATPLLAAAYTNLAIYQTRIAAR